MPTVWTGGIHRLSWGPGPAMCPRFPLLHSGTRWWACKHCPRRRQTQPWLCFVPSEHWDTTLTGRKASGPQTSSFLSRRPAERECRLQAEDGPLDAITLAYQAQGVICPFRLRAHSKRSVASSWVLARGALLTDICRAAGWATPNTFARFYSLRVEPVSSCVLTSNG